ncbi:hypothetical protein SALBM135S_07271 [Streptomyces alboniger]
MRRVCLTLPTNRACPETIAAIGAEAAYATAHFDVEVHLLILDSSDPATFAAHAAAVRALPDNPRVGVHHLGEPEQRAFLSRVISRADVAKPELVLELMLPAAVSYGACTNRAFLLAAALGRQSVHRRDSDSRYQVLDGEPVFPIHHELASLGRSAADARTGGPRSPRLHAARPLGGQRSAASGCSPRRTPASRSTSGPGSRATCWPCRTRRRTTRTSAVQRAGARRPAHVAQSAPARHRRRRGPAAAGPRPPPARRAHRRGPRARVRAALPGGRRRQRPVLGPAGIRSRQGSGPPGRLRPDGRVHVQGGAGRPGAARRRSGLMRVLRVRDPFHRGQLAIAALFCSLGFQYAAWRRGFPPSRRTST